MVDADIFSCIMGFDDACNISLSLALNPVENAIDQIQFDQKNSKESSQTTHNLFPSLSLCLSSSEPKDDEKNAELHRQTSSVTVVSSYSDHYLGFKRKKEVGGEVEGEVEKATTKISSLDYQDEDESSPRKKLRLTKEQSAVLEDSFKEHTTLNPKQKQALAMELNLRPRQVEVWFQNRRARTKLKQTEIECVLLKKCCETLTEEKRRLEKEVQELKALKLGPPLCIQMPHSDSAPTLTICPSCEKTGAAKNPNFFVKP